MADSLWIGAMYDCHLFHRLEGATVDEVIANWLEHNFTLNPAIVGGEKVNDLGPSDLCPSSFSTATTSFAESEEWFSGRTTRTRSIAINSTPGATSRSPTRIFLAFLRKERRNPMRVTVSDHAVLRYLEQWK